MNYLSDHIRQLWSRYFALQHPARSAKRSVRQGLASAGGWASRKRIQEALLKKVFPTSIATFQLIGRANRVKAFSCVITIFFASCAVLDTHQAKLDQQQLRDVLMDYTQDQILDNLIRASNGLPIVHFDLSNITGQVTSKFTPTVGGGRNVTDVRTRTPMHSTVTTNQTTTAATGQTIVNTVAKTVSAVGGVVETVAKPLSWGVGEERDNGISVQADPLIDEPDVYAAYIRFLNTDVVTEESENVASPADTEDETRNGTKVTKITTATTQPTAVKTNTVTEPAGTASSAQSQTASRTTTTEMKEFAATSSTTEEKTPKAKPPSKVDLVVKSFSSIKSLRKSPTAPAPADVLVGPKRWKDGMYYWVPKQYQKQFFALCMATVARGATSGPTDAVKAVKEQTATIRRQQLQ